ncbi:uncharacterized protein KY384_005449 [Bacidia gigantensis]|uniref:uncharacterized protein n=1 Tax=Bacidia gigantensis TaxID=2732470 RepID=UPI001D042B0F|nr:uncharacterized protein KY384_005449 [Bacidia gigantensis]KAG8529967.1 hypothetical protein KY384_005449 [Bacidia gigantensis]
MKYVLVSGGTISGIGKGVIASSTGLLLKSIGLKVSSIKIDPYLNLDAGLMSPMEHGEVFVLDDGGEVDLDLGNYERDLDMTLTRENNLTTGKIYQHVISRERKGEYLGKTVQMVPHVTTAIVEWIERVARIPVDDTNESSDICVIELGGTVGDIESAPFIEAMRQLRRRAGRGNFLQIHVTPILVVKGELKTKPTQTAIKDARMQGLAPDLIACRCPIALDEHASNKVALYGDVDRDQVLSVIDVPSLYHVPLSLHSQNMLGHLRGLLGLDSIEMDQKLVSRGAKNWKAWRSLTLEQDRIHESVTIALLGKYTEHPDAYHSVEKALEHAAMACSRKLDLKKVSSEFLEASCKENAPAEYHKAWHSLHTANGVIVPGGFGERGTSGMIDAIKMCRENGIPFLGICLGMQLAVIEYARNVGNIPSASSAEFDEGVEDPIVIYMPEVDRTTMGATMRLGLRPTYFQPDSEFSQLRKLYEGKAKDIVKLNQTNKGSIANGTAHVEATGKGAIVEKPVESELNPLVVNERHRHRYEVNPKYVTRLSQAGLPFIGKDESGERMEIIELRNHKWEAVELDDPD